MHRNCLSALGSALTILVVLFSANAPARAEAPDVLVSIKPLHSLTAMVLDGVGSPTLLIDGVTSPHGFTLRPSQRRGLAEADLVIWIGPALEGFLEKPLLEDTGAPANLAVTNAAGIRLRKAAHDHHNHDEGHAKEDEHAVAAAHGDDHDDDQMGVDPHLWLDPQNAIAAVNAISEALAKVDPPHAAIYRSNADRAIQRISNLEKRLTEELAPYHDAYFATQHDAYGYFTNRFGLHPAEPIALSPETPPSAKRMVELREEIREEAIRCVFSEPEFPDRHVRTLVEGTNAHTAKLDPLGANLPAGPDQYPALMTAIAASITGCLSGQ